MGIKSTQCSSMWLTYKGRWDGVHQLLSLLSFKPSYGTPWGREQKGPSSVIKPSKWPSWQLCPTTGKLKRVEHGTLDLSDCQRMYLPTLKNLSHTVIRGVSHCLHLKFRGLTCTHCNHSCEVPYSSHLKKKKRNKVGNM